MQASSAVPTTNGAKYIQQLCRHWAHKLEVSFSDGSGTVRFPAATAGITAEQDRLMVTIEATDGEVLERMKEVLRAHLDRFAFREAPLQFDWTSAE